MLKLRAKKAQKTTTIFHILHFLRLFFESEFVELCFCCLCLDPHNTTSPLLPDLLKPLIVVGLHCLHKVIEGALVLTTEETAMSP